LVDQFLVKIAAGRLGDIEPSSIVEGGEHGKPDLWGAGDAFDDESVRDLKPRRRLG
jgi:hypothetical protein